MNIGGGGDRVNHNVGGFIAMGRAKGLRNFKYVGLLTLVTGIAQFSCLNVCDQNGVTSPADLVASNDVIAVGTLVSCDTVHIFKGWEHLPNPPIDQLPILVAYSLAFRVDEWLTSNPGFDTVFVWLTKYETHGGSIPDPFKYGLQVVGKSLIYGSIVVDSGMSILCASTGLYSKGNIEYYSSDPELFAPYFKNYAVEALNALQNSSELQFALKNYSQHGVVVAPADDLSVMTYYCWGVGMHWHDGDSRQKCRNGSSSDYLKEVGKILRKREQ